MNRLREVREAAERVLRQHDASRAARLVATDWLERNPVDPGPYREGQVVRLLGTDAMMYVDRCYWKRQPDGDHHWVVYGDRAGRPEKGEVGWDVREVELVASPTAQKA